MPNQVRSFAVALCMLCGLVGIANAQTPASAPDFQFTAASDSATTAFHLYDKLILIDVSVNGSKPLPFALDSGSDHTVIDQGAAKALGLAIGSPSLPSHGAATVSDVNLAWTGFEWLDQSPEVADLAGLAPVMGVRIDGILGADLFEQFVIVVRYGKGSVSFYDPANFHYTGGGAPIYPHMRDGLPVVATNLMVGSKPVVAMLELDTGSVDDLTLNGSFAKSSGWADSVSNTVSEPPTAPGELPRRYARITALRIKSIALSEPVAAFSGSDTTRIGDGSIGGPILSRFTVVFDYPRKQIFLEPNQAMGASGRPFPFDASGLILTARGPDTFRIAAVLPGSPADSAGLKPGDLLTAIDGKPTATMTLDNLRRLFQQSGKEYEVTYVRGGRKATATIALRAML
jgi:hypothetical protein